MDDEEIKKIIDSPEEYDESKEDIYRSMVRDFFSKRMSWTIIILFAHLFFFLALAILCGILFLMTDQTKLQIMYAAFFVCCILIGYLIKVFAWVMGIKNSISREIKRLELRIAELTETVKNQQK